MSFCLHCGKQLPDDANSALNAEHLSAVRKRGTKVTVNRYMLEKL